jgi:NADPH-dependent 2,4-dienoyl-CoA reductase/sulfur reductase-like enzyme/peroxiredoxin family protein/TusA-related sulfurtransferase/rhodanese-related sulfurtransferase
MKTDRVKLLIVGGVAGGASAAARARRLSESAEIVVLERGDYVSFANCGLPYHIGGTIPERDRLLVQTPDGLRRRFRIDVRTATEVVKVDRERKVVVARERGTGNEYEESYDKLVLSPGAEPVVPSIPGATSQRVMTLRSMADMDRIKDFIAERDVKTALVVGAGYVGLEMAEALSGRGIHVVLVEKMGQAMGPMDPEMAAHVHRELALHGVDLRLGCTVQSFSEDSGSLHAQLSTGENMSFGMAVLSVGVRPETRLAREAGLEIGETGGIRVDEHMRTSDHDIFAVGDAVEVTDLVGGFQTLVPLAGPANRQGRVAADNCFGRDSTYEATQGTAICKVFNVAVGMTGQSEKVLKRRNIRCEKIYVHPASHASYYPGASPIALKLLFDPEGGRILGAQVVGADGVDKRIDVLAVAIRAGMTVYDLEKLELAYAPPYGSAKDPVNYAGFVASNVLRGDVKLCHVEDVADLSGKFLLDVRTAVEFGAGSIPGSVNIPIDELRDRLAEIPRDVEVLVTCQVGLRGYLACRILEENGIHARNLTGGYKTYLDFTGACPRPAPVHEEMKSDTGVDSAACVVPALDAQRPVEPVREIDASGLQCPGPIMRLKDATDTMKPGEAVTVLATDPGFMTDVVGWCNSTGNGLVETRAERGAYRATVVKRERPASAGAAPASARKRHKTIVVFSNDFDRVMAAFIIANGAAAMGSKVTLFFTFWGLNVLRRHAKVSVRKSLVERLFGWMMPRGARRLSLSKMNMAGVGTAMMKRVMKDKNVLPLEELIAQAQKNGVRLVACSMTMGIMGIRKEELIDGVEEGGVAMYLDNAEGSDVNLFV